MLIRFYWAQVNLKNSLVLIEEYIIPMHAFKDLRLHPHYKEKISYLLCNYGQINYSQKEGKENKFDSNVGKNILILFLKLANRKVLDKNIKQQGTLLAHRHLVQS